LGSKRQSCKTARAWLAVDARGYGNLVFSLVTQSSVVACRSSLSVEAGPGSTRNQT